MYMYIAHTLYLHVRSMQRVPMFFILLYSIKKVEKNGRFHVCALAIRTLVLADSENRTIKLRIILFFLSNLH